MWVYLPGTRHYSQKQLHVCSLSLSQPPPVWPSLTLDGDDLVVLVQNLWPLWTRRMAVVFSQMLVVLFRLMLTSRGQNCMLNFQLERMGSRNMILWIHGCRSEICFGS